MEMEHYEILSHCQSAHNPENGTRIFNPQGLDTSNI